jgi:hypothetical protein
MKRTQQLVRRAHIKNYEHNFLLNHKLFIRKWKLAKNLQKMLVSFLPEFLKSGQGSAFRGTWVSRLSSLLYFKIDFSALVA